MDVFSNKPARVALATILAASAASGIAAQELEPAVAGANVPAATEANITVQGTVPADISGFPDGPEIEGFISARNANGIQVTGIDGTKTTVAISQGTKIKSSGGFLGLNRKALGMDSLLNGLPVTVETVQWAGNLVASQVELKSKDLKTAAMIRNGTDQRFGANEAAINQNAAATEALRGRMGDIDKYNLKGTTNVYFDTGKWALQPGAIGELCNAAAEADAMDNALLLVVGYTDSVGDEDYNQVLSERRAGRVVNTLQQKCGWKPWRMLTPTGMAESDPMADNSTAEGRRQNRRVSVNILVSKAVDEG